MSENSDSPSTAIQVAHTGTVLRVTINRPDRLNALSLDMLRTLAEIIEHSGPDPDVRAIVLSGVGRAFCSGADLSGRELTGESGPASVTAANRVTRALRAIPKPVLAAVNGPAVGVGCSFALAADLTIAAESAYFLLAFARIGLMPDGGATALLPAAVGKARATRMAMLAEPINAPLAKEWGMIGETIADTDLPTRIDELADQLANGPTIAFAETKRAFNATTLAHLEDALENEYAGQSALFRTADLNEGVEAFNHKRTPQFRGR